MGADTVERHLVAASLLGGAQTVLDVGGTPGALAAALPGAHVTTLNRSPGADVVGDAAELPFPNDSFDAATSLDVLEHLPREQWQAHVDELKRVARRVAVLCCPLGGAEHERIEAGLDAWLRQKGLQHEFLSEHVHGGLPSEHELRELSPTAMLFHGDVNVAAARFRARALARRGAVLGVLADAIRQPDVATQQEATPATNRAFLVWRV